jgi:NADH-quinone oxidoreductase subunit N
MFINENESPIEKFSSDNYMKISLVICLIGIIVLGLTSGVYESINLVSFGMK